MGLSSNQARFLSLTSRQVDLEQRVQQICQRRLRLSSELEKVATQYNDSISNRKMFVPQPSGIQNLSLENLASLGLKVMHAQTNSPVQFASGISQITETQALAMGYDANHIIHDAAEFTSKLSADLAGNFIMVGDANMASLGVLTNSAITGVFSGQFDGNGYSVQNLSINTGGAAVSNVGLFSNITNGSVKNLIIANSSVNASQSSNVGALAGYISNSSVSDIYAAGVVTGEGAVGGLVGRSSTTSTISNTAYEGSVNLVNDANWGGGLVGWNQSGSVIENSYSTADLTGGDWVGGLVGVNNNASVTNSFATGTVSGYEHSIGGFVGENQSSGTITNSYSTGDANGTIFTSAAFSFGIGGFAGNNATFSTITNSYTTGDVSAIAGTATVGGFVGQSFGSTGATNFYQNNMSTTGGTAVDANVSPMPTGTWDTNAWDLSGAYPTLRDVGPVMPSSDIETKLRNGEYYLATEADEFSQDPFGINGENYEKVDWRTVPGIYDELYKGDDVDAEDKYDRTIAQINSQDKKLQLEQSSVEVEYKAISSEKEAVKKILDANSSSSFKYFS